MQKLKYIPLLALVFFIASCASTVRFPVSTVVPAADIVAKKKEDKNGNYNLTVTAKNLASAERLNPSSNYYVVWIQTESEGIRSVGRLLNKNAKTASIEAITPFNFQEVFITAEKQDGLSIPLGPEISRARFKK